MFDRLCKAMFGLVGRFCDDLLREDGFAGFVVDPDWARHVSRENEIGFLGRAIVTTGAADADFSFR